MKNIMEKIAAAKETENPHYTMRSSDITEIFKNSKDAFAVLSNGFAFGYLQGMKAAKAAARRKAKV